MSRMNKRTAVRTIDSLLKDSSVDLTQKECEALEMAIDILEADMVSKEAVIKAISKHINKYGELDDDISNIVEEAGRN